MNRARTARIPAAALLLALAACASTGDEGRRRDVPWLVSHGHFQEAAELAAEERERRPDDPAAVRQHELAQAALLMERGRRLVFADRDEEALELFEQARELAPESPEVGAWIANTHAKLGERFYRRGQALHQADDLHGAVATYERALEHDPEHVEVKQSLARALLQINHRGGVGERYYREGVDAMDEYWLEQARSRFAYSLKYVPGNERAEDRRQQTRELLASRRAALALELEEQGRYAAARNEYRLALLLDEGQPEALEGYERMRQEEAAANALREADALLLRKRFAAALERLEGLEQQSRLQGDAVADLRAKIQEARLEDLYAGARALEADERYEEAVGAYGALLELTPFFRDAIARRDTLQSYVDEALRLYAAAEQAQGDERATLLRRIRVFWPGYRDVAEQLAALAPAEAPAPAEPAATPDEAAVPADDAADDPPADPPLADADADGATDDSATDDESTPPHAAAGDS